jgi:uncharacterized membrane protein
MRLYFKLLLFLAILVWCLGIFSEWLLPINNNILFAIPFLKNSFSLVCHQLRDRLITSNNCETLVCARCTGIYLGLLLSSFVMLFIHLKISLHIKYFFIAAMPLVSDVIFYSINIYQYSRTIAFCTGLLFGSIGFLYLYNVLNQLFNEMKSGNT